MVGVRWITCVVKGIIKHIQSIVNYLIKHSLAHLIMVLYGSNSCTCFHHSISIHLEESLVVDISFYSKCYASLFNQCFLTPYLSALMEQI